MLVGTLVQQRGEASTNLPVYCGPLRVRKHHIFATAVDKLALDAPESIEALLLAEVQAAYAYFAAWQMLPLRWKGTGRKPIPPGWPYIVTRPLIVSGRSRHATHLVNAMLNHACEVLES
jgi:CRISPR/Cas system-associated endonuclease Cas1